MDVIILVLNKEIRKYKRRTSIKPQQIKDIIKSLTIEKYKLDTFYLEKIHKSELRLKLSRLYYNNYQKGNGLFITLVPKVYNNVFLFVGLITLGTFDWLIKLSVQTFQPKIVNVHQFIGHCLIPLDPWMNDSTKKLTSYPCLHLQTARFPWLLQSALAPQGFWEQGSASQRTNGSPV